MKQLLITIAAVVLVGCGESQQSATAPEAEPIEPLAEAKKPEPAKADTSFFEAAFECNVEAVKKHLAVGTYINIRDNRDVGRSPLMHAMFGGLNSDKPPGIVIVLVVVLFVLGAVYYTKKDKERTKHLNVLAEKLNLQFSAKGDDSIIEGFNQLAVYSDEEIKHLNTRFDNMLHGEINGVELSIYEFCASRNHKSGIEQTVIHFRSSKLKLPQFALRPKRTFWDKGLFGQDIDFQTHPVFSRRYVLRAKDKGTGYVSSVRDLFNNDLLTFCESLKEICIEGRDDELVVYRFDKVTKVNEIEQFMEKGLEVFQRFCPSV